MSTAHTSSSIQNRVMLRVRTVHLLRSFSGPVAAAVVFAAAVYAIGREVWVARVFENMPHVADAVAVGNFFLEAFINTRTVVQVLTLLAAVAFVWLVREMARTVVHTGLRIA